MEKLLKRTKTRWQRIGSSITSLCVALGVTGLAGAPAMAAIESITGYGRYWNFDTNNNYNKVSSGYLGDVDRYKALNGPCYGKSRTGCKFDSRTISTLNGKRIESVTAYGSYWNWEILNSNTYNLLSNGSLNNVARYANGPCQGKSSGTCTFDSLAIVNINGQMLESITAYGQYWNYDINNNYNKVSSGVLNNVTRYANGPCKDKPSGSCKFDTREFFSISGGFLESVTAYGRYWNFDSRNNYQPVEGNPGGELTEVDHYKSSACNGQAPGTCTFGTRAFL